MTKRKAKRKKEPSFWGVFYSSGFDDTVLVRKFSTEESAEDYLYKLIEDGDGGAQNYPTDGYEDEDGYDEYTVDKMKKGDRRLKYQHEVVKQQKPW